MAGSLNKVLLIGRLSADPEIKQMVNGKSVARLSLATFFPLTICFISGSAPNLPIKSTLFKLPAILFILIISQKGFEY